MTDLARWASCGAMALTGDPGGPPLAPPTRVGPVLDEALHPFGLGAEVVAERAALLGLRRAGRRSCGGATRLLEAADGWVALSLARPADVEALPAVFETGAADVPDVPTAWARLPALVAARPADEVVARAGLLGVACARLGEPVAPFAVRGGARTGGPRPGPVPAPLVVDLSALWAGPLAASLLGRLWARVVKVEDRRRPDGARLGPPSFFALLNAGKRSVALDLGRLGDREALAGLVDRADVVVTSARARALDQLGLDPDRFLAGAADRVWVAVTGHGWACDRVGFGDDAAVAAGLVARHPDDGTPRFAADALADPTCGALAARAALDAWTGGGRWFVDAGLAGAAAAVVGGGPTRVATPTGPGGPAGGWEVEGRPVAAPAPRAPGGPGPALGSDTAAVLGGEAR